MAKKTRRPLATPRSLRSVPALEGSSHNDESDASSAATPDTIVGIGASAGGVEAVTKLLQHVTADSGLAYVLVQHLAPKQESLLAEVLAPASRIPVVQAQELMPILPNRLHVIPPNVHMTIIDGHLHMAPRPADRTQYNPIDAFFQSLAQQGEHRSVGVVLSGSASDGAAGLRDIKAAGGVTMAQDPKTARYDGMPRAAIATGAVDIVLPPDGIAEELVRLGSHPFLSAPDRTRVQELAITEAQLARLYLLLRSSSGVDFTHYKLPTVKRRLQRRMAINKLTDVDTYLRMLEHDPVESRDLYRDILIHVTRFFREPDSYALLKKLVFPRIVADAASKRPVRIWVPGCATGEEAYSIAIALLEHLGADATSMPAQVFATDVSEEAIDRARTGLYQESISADVSPERLRRFFTRVDGQYRIAKTVRDLCIFARQDLTRDPPFSKLDLIVCRNVLIYLGPQLQKKLIGVFYYALKASGFLMLGGTETVGPHAEHFSLADKRHKIYLKRDGRLRGDLDYLVIEDMAFERDHERLQPAAPAAAPPRNDLHTEVTRVLLGRYSPPGVVIDNDLQIVQTRGKTGAFLELGSGEASLNVLKMAREGVLHGIRSVIKEVRKSNKPARREGLLVKGEGTTREIDIQVFPLSDVADSPHFLVLFEDRAKTREDRAEPAVKRGKGKDDPRIPRLEQELSSSRDYMQSIIQDLEAANEELQSANEEILSSNEELQSTNEELDTAKEELQSTNEELNTVNEELNARNDELSQANADLMNLLSAVPAAIVIVTRDLRIRRFTPLAEHVLNLIPTDVGRPLGNLKPNIDVPDLDELTREVIDTVTIKRLEVSDRSGRFYILQVRPYKDQENRIDGAVISLTDSPPAGA